MHVTDAEPSALISYYARLFDPATTKASAIGDVPGIEADGIFLPVRAAQWYRDRFAAVIATNPANAPVRPPNPIHRRPAAIVTLPGITFAIYHSPSALAPSRGRRIDHIAFKADLHDARADGFTVLDPSGRLGRFATTMIEGPDRLAIELVSTRCAPGC